MKIKGRLGKGRFFVTEVHKCFLPWYEHLGLENNITVYDIFEFLCKKYNLKMGEAEGELFRDKICNCLFKSIMRPNGKKNNYYLKGLICEVLPKGNGQIGTTGHYYFAKTIEERGRVKLISKASIRGRDKQLELRDGETKSFLKELSYDGTKRLKK